MNPQRTMIPLCVPNVSEREARNLQECIHSTFVSSVGPFVAEFEEKVAKCSGGLSAVSTSSGTSALHLALVSAGVRRDDLVIIPDFTFIATANAVSHAGATPWLMDIDPKSWTLDIDLLDKALSTETRRMGTDLIHAATQRRIGAIMPVYTLGMPAQMDRICELAREYGIPVIADAAAAIGAEFQGKTLASWADLTVFSFNGNKTITTGGGGAITGRQEAMLKKTRHLCTTARLGLEYDHDEVGYNYRMTNLQAAVGCAQLVRLDEFLEIKKRIRTLYNEELGSLPGIGLFPDLSDRKSTYWFSGITIEDPKLPSVTKLCAKLKENGIEGRTFWRPMHLQKPYLSAPRTLNGTTETLHSKILTLPCSTNLPREDQEYVVETLRKLLVRNL